MLIIQVKSFVSFFGTYFAYIIIKKGGEHYATGICKGKSCREYDGIYFR